jgi:hypothetical protein
MNWVEYPIRNGKNYGVSVVKFHLTYALYFSKIHLLSGLSGVLYIAVIVIGS